MLVLILGSLILFIDEFSLILFIHEFSLILFSDEFSFVIDDLVVISSTLIIFSQTFSFLAYHGFQVYVIRQLLVFFCFMPVILKRL